MTHPMFSKMGSKWIWLLVICIAVAGLAVWNIKSQSSKEKVEAASSDPLSVLLTPDKVYCTDEGGNVGWTECMIEKLDRIAAEREWKQRKLETIKHPEINTYDMFVPLEKEQEKIRNWRENFEKSRDLWCDAQHTFISGSGTPGGIAQCAIEFELLAIKDLNSLYYDIIYSTENFYIMGSEGIKDFEPTKADIDALVKTNKTVRGCVWADDPACD